MAISPATRKFLDRNKTNRRPQQFQQQPRFIQQTPQMQNMFAKDPTNPNPMESTLGLLFGAEGEQEIGRQQAIFPSLTTSDVGSVVGSVQDELGIFSHEPQQMQRRMPTRRRRR